MAQRESTEVYRQIVGQIRLRLDEVSLPFWKIDDLAGVQDGYTAKALAPDTPSGRQATWPMLQLILEALYPAGFSVVIIPHVETGGRALLPPPQPRPNPAHKRPSRQPLPAPRVKVAVEHDRAVLAA